MTVQTEVSSTLKERAKDQYKGWKKPVKKIPFLQQFLFQTIYRCPTRYGRFN